MLLYSNKWFRQSMLLTMWTLSKKNKLENVAITVVLPRAASRCARTRSHSHTRSPARWLAVSRTRSNSLALCCKPSSVRSLPLFLKRIRQATKFCENVFIGVGDSEMRRQKEI